MQGGLGGKVHLLQRPIAPCVQRECCHDRRLLPILCVAAMACRAFLLDSYGSADLVHVPCQRFARPGALPPGWVAARPARQVTRSENGAWKDATGSWCRQVVTGVGRLARRMVRAAL